MNDIDIMNGYKIKQISTDSHNIVEKLCMECPDYYILHYGKLPDVHDIDEIFTAIPPGKDYKDKFVMGIYGGSNELDGLIDIIKDYPENRKWMLGLMLIKPANRNNGLGKAAHKALANSAVKLGAKSFRIGVIEENYKGINFWSHLGYKKIKEINMDFEEKTHVVNVMELKL